MRDREFSFLSSERWARGSGVVPRGPRRLHHPHPRTSSALAAATARGGVLGPSWRPWDRSVAFIRICLMTRDGERLPCSRPPSCHHLPRHPAHVCGPFLNWVVSSLLSPESSLYVLHTCPLPDLRLQTLPACLWLINTASHSLVPFLTLLVASVAGLFHWVV